MKVAKKYRITCMYIQQIHCKLPFMLFKCMWSLGLRNPIPRAAMHACASANDPLLIVALFTISAT